MILWRLTRFESIDHEHDAYLAGKFGGRWNERGRPVVYASSSKALAVLEWSVQAGIHYLTDVYRYMAYPIFVPSTVPIDRIKVSELPDMWFDRDWMKCQAFLRDRMESSGKAVYLVPSAIVYGEYDAVIDISHPDATKLIAGINESIFQSDRPLVQSSISQIDIHRQVFLCHASEDKGEIVEPIYRELLQTGISCWLDAAEIKWGESILAKVNDGLSSSNFVIAVITPAFLNKNWPKRELMAALNKEAGSGESIVLPLLCGDDSFRKKVSQELFLLSDKLYAVWDGNPQKIVHLLRQRLTLV